MQRKTKLILGTAVVAVVIVLIIASLVMRPKPKPILSIATGPAGGTNHIVGSAIASVVMKYNPDLKITVEETPAASKNLDLVEEGVSDCGFISLDDMYKASQGMEPYKKKYVNVRHGFSLWIAAQKLVVLKGSGIEKWEDLRGKKIALGEPGHFSIPLAKAILEAYGLKEGDYKAEYISWTEVCDKLADGTIDAFFVPALDPWGPLAKLALARDIRILPVSEEKIKEITQKYPYYVRTVVPAGSYRGINEDIPTVGPGIFFGFNANLDEETVYRIVKTVFEHLDEIYSAHPAARKITLSHALDGQLVPLHPGAEKYFREVGLIKK
ncbi:MAG: TAXI family TRAP transporter solute-binding subunit [Thermofilum sp.]|nr:TAXI family TRAP transporter solute-binding subunit [Thermofilum sp.]